LEKAGMKAYLFPIAIMNFVFVLLMVFGPHEFVYPAVFTAIILFSYSITANSTDSLKLVGGIFNFMGVVAGGLTGVESVEYMALIGSIFLLSGYIGSSTTKKTKSR